MLDNAASLQRFLPELLVSCGAVFVLLLDLLLTRSRWRVAGAVACSGVTLLAATIATAWVAQLDAQPVALFSGMVALDPWALLFKYLAWGITALGVLMAAPSLEISRERMAEYCALLLAISVGLALMSSATDLLMVALSIELVSIVSYALAGFRKGDRRSAEAALKYVVYGGVASGMMLFGMSYLYGLTGSTSVVRMGPALAAVLASEAQGGVAQLTVLAGLSLVLAGVGYKIASVPWHMWCPDVYEGAPTPFTAFLSVGPKAAGFALAVRLFYGALSQPAGELSGALAELPWPALVGILSALTMTVGNFAALGQTNLKRLLAYSSIAHAGYLLMGLAAASVAGSTAIALYLVIYLFMNVGAFLVVGAVSRITGDESLTEFRGLSSRAPFAAVAFAIFLFSLTGLPPLGGFIGKFHLFKALIDHGGTWQVGLALVGVLNSAVSLYYYARIVRAMFLDGPALPTPVPLPRTYAWLLAGCVVAVVGLGIVFEPLRGLAERSLRLFGQA